jgi:membrane protein
MEHLQWGTSVAVAESLEASAMSVEEPKPYHKMTTTEYKELGKKTFQNFSQDNVPRLAAAFSFYAMLSLAPFLVLAVLVASYFFGGEQEAQQRLITTMNEAMGPEGSEFIVTLLENAREPGASIPALLISLGVMFFAASNLFLQLRESAIAIWGLPPKYRGFKQLIWQRITAFIMVLVAGAILIGWMILDSWLTYMARAGEFGWWWQVVNFVLTILFLSGIFMLAFRMLPRGYLKWSDVWVPGAVTAVGFAILKWALGLYFANADIGSAYGPAGALIIVMLWFYYTSILFFFGIELSYAYAHLHGSQMDRTETRDERSGNPMPGRSDADEPEEDEEEAAKKRRAYYMR